MENNKQILLSLGCIVLGIMLGWFLFKTPTNSHVMTDTTMSDTMHAMSSSLEGKTGDDFDKAFLSEMIVHHEGAVVMAQQVLKTSKRPELLKLANEIISAQTQEITQMKTWKYSWFK